MATVTPSALLRLNPIIVAAAMSTLCLGATGTVSAQDGPGYEVQFIGTGFPNAMNGLGDVVGWRVVDGASRAWVYTAEDGQRLLPLPPGALQSRASDVNDDGVIVGSAWTDVFDDPGQAIKWLPDGGGYIAVEIATDPGDTKSSATAINNFGVVVGARSFRVNVGGRNREVTRPYRHSDATGFEDLSLLGFSALPADINDAGQIVGGSLRLTGDVVEDLGRPEGSFRFTALSAINDSGQAAGSASRTCWSIRTGPYSARHSTSTSTMPARSPRSARTARQGKAAPYC
jgi:uncharacterized membrane protein